MSMIEPVEAPLLSTLCVQPLESLVQHCLSHRERIESWFLSEWQKTPAPVYGSVDLRNAGFKLAPIDMNLFPAGFNNLNQSYLSLSIEAVKRVIERAAPHAKKVLLIPESHTRNIKYWDNINTLQRILNQAGFEVRFGFLGNEITLPYTMILSNGESLLLETIVRNNNHLAVDGFEPDFILLNNDLSDGIPDILKGLHQTIYPPAELGWSARLKSLHFQYYAAVADEFAAVAEIDPWLIAPLFTYCSDVDFMQQSGMQCLIAHAERLFADIQKKYQTYGITHQPFIVVKADAGTYGMAVMMVKSIDELRNMNRKQRTKMSSIKGGQRVNRVIIQEGVYTFETVGHPPAVAEPVVYLFGESVVGGFYRIHEERGIDENLNAPGMKFTPLAFKKPCHKPCQLEETDHSQNQLYAYGLIARLSMLAAAREMRDIGG